MHSALTFQISEEKGNDLPSASLWPFFMLKGVLEIYLTRFQLDNIDG